MAEARAILTFTPKAAAPMALKVLNSAVANAENNLDLTQDTLFVAECYANQGPSLKRFRPRAHGRANRILKRTSHITSFSIRQVKEEHHGSESNPHAFRVGVINDWDARWYRIQEEFARQHRRGTRKSSNTLRISSLPPHRQNRESNAPPPSNRSTDSQLSPAWSRVRRGVEARRPSFQVIAALNLNIIGSKTRRQRNRGVTENIRGFP